MDERVVNGNNSTKTVESHANGTATTFQFASPLVRFGKPLAKQERTRAFNDSRWNLVNSNGIEDNSENGKGES